MCSVLDLENLSLLISEHNWISTGLGSFTGAPSGLYYINSFRLSARELRGICRGFQALASFSFVIPPPLIIANLSNSYDGSVGGALQPLHTTAHSRRQHNSRPNLTV